MDAEIINGAITIKDNTGEVKQAFKEQAIKALTECGLIGEGYAKVNLTNNGSVVTGNLRNSMTCQVVESENAVYIGSNVEYAPYVELGTSHSQAKPYLKPAVTDHGEEYQKILNKCFKDGSTTLS